jgi:glutathione synthase/RimK-type ligase-like ATP-grasp enzyme
MYELRIFFLGEKYFPMAIFSQGNRNTEVDYRHYDEKKENRAVPYVLPNDLENKLKRLMMKIGLNSGSIDIIVDDNYDYIFLEVNPVGQFEWLSANCNYFIEREIAKYIVDERENDK